MKDYLVRYSLGLYVYETVVRTSSSHAAIVWVENTIKFASNISVVEEKIGI